MPEITQHLCTIDNCNEPAVALYAWPWGENGACCQRHQFIVSQQARSLKREVAISPISVTTPPMSRDERQQKHAQILALGDENAELKQRGADMYNDNTRLQAECRRLMARNGELEIQLQSSMDAHTETAKERDDMTAERNEIRTELERVKLLVQKKDYEAPTVTELKPWEAAARGLPVSPK